MKRILVIIISFTLFNAKAQKKISLQVFAELNAVGLKGIHNSFEYQKYRLIDTPTNKFCRYNYKNESQQDAVIKLGGVLGIKFNYSLSKNLSAFIGTSVNIFSMEYNHTDKYYTTDSTILNLKRVNTPFTNYAWLDEEKNKAVYGSDLSIYFIGGYYVNSRKETKEILKFVTLSFPIGLSYKFKNSKISVNGEVCPMLRLSYSSSTIPKGLNNSSGGYYSNISPLFNGNKPQSLLQLGAGINYAVTKRIDFGLKFNHFTSNIKTVSTNEKLSFNMIGLQFHYLIKYSNAK